MKITRKEEEFTKSDWYGYSGAVSKNDYEPIIAEFQDENNPDNSIDLMMSYDDIDPDSEKCSVHLSFWRGDDEFGYSSTSCDNRDIAYDLFRSIYKEFQNVNFEEAINRIERKGFIKTI